MPVAEEPSGDERFRRAIEAIDQANADDPNTIVVDGVERPKELAHAEMMCRWVRQLDPDADEAQLLAARAHHLRRWTIPRSSYSKDRKGYLRWRTALKRQHGEDVARILADVGYDPETVERVQRIVRKDDLRTDPCAQTHEDALCLVFLETQFADLVDDLGEDKAVEVVVKTLAKMSERGRHAALGLRYGDRERVVLEQALVESG